MSRDRRPGSDPADPAALADLAVEVGRLLRGRRETVALAESCTGGLIAAALTTVPGASEYLWGGAVVYTAASKQALAGLDAATLESHGTVSAATTEALAAAIRRLSGATYGLAVTGWAGPDAQPGGFVGTVFAALDDGGEIIERRWQLPGDRQQVRDAAATRTLALLRARLQAKLEPVSGGSSR
jgi:PncC family amidohydrolase